MWKGVNSKQLYTVGFWIAATRKSLNDGFMYLFKTMFNIWNFNGINTTCAYESDVHLAETKYFTFEYRTFR